MPRADRESLSGQLLRILKRGPHTVAQLSEMTGRHNQTVRDTLRSMSAAGIISQVTEAALTKPNGSVKKWAIND